MEGERGMGVERVSQGAIVTRGRGPQGLQREAVCMQSEVDVPDVPLDGRATGIRIKKRMPWKDRWRN